MAEGRSWNITIPVRPKAVQSARGARGHFHVDPKVRRWKDSIRPFIKEACGDLPPSKLPIEAVRLKYVYRLPKNTKKSVLEFVSAGGIVPYLAPVDITDNLSKGVIDVCKGLVFEDDSQIWLVSNVQKVYGTTDRIELSFKETPEIMLINGKRGASDVFGNQV